jgi:flagellar motor switch protein FliG
MEAVRAQDGGVFLNGRKQIIEMLKFMQPEERDTLLKNIQLRNPQMARELIAESISFNDLNRLKNSDLLIIFKYIQPAILGMALKTVDQGFQKRVLSLAPRPYAEQAFKVLTTPMNRQRDTERAQEKIVAVLSTLKKKDQISL